MDLACQMSIALGDYVDNLFSNLTASFPGCSPQELPKEASSDRAKDGTAHDRSPGVCQLVLGTAPAPFLPEAAVGDQQGPHDNQAAYNNL